MNWRKTETMDKSSWRDTEEETNSPQEPGLLGQSAKLVGDVIDYTYAPIRQAMLAPKRLVTGEISEGLFAPVKQLFKAPSEAPTTSEVLEQYGVPKEKKVQEFGAANPLLASTYEMNPLPDDPGNVTVYPSEEGANIVDQLAGGAGMGLIAKGAAPLATKARNVADLQAFRQSGAMLKDFRKGRSEQIGRFMLDNRLFNVGDDFDDITKKARVFNENAGKRLDQIYSSVKERLPGLKKRSTGFNPVRDKAKILSQVKDSLGDAEGSGRAVRRLSNYLTELGSKYGDQVLDPRIANDIKGAMDDLAGHARNPLTRKPEVEKGFTVARRAVEKMIAEDIDEIGKSMGKTDLSKSLRAANRDYGMSKEVFRIAKDRTDRENANRIFGLTDTIAGTAGAVTGYSQGGLEDAGIGLLMGTLANKGIRKYGPGLLSKGADVAGRGLLRVNPEIFQEIGAKSAILNRRKKKDE
jgi:hypothetical protein